VVSVVGRVGLEPTSRRLRVEQEVSILASCVLLGIMRPGRRCADRAAWCGEPGARWPRTGSTWFHRTMPSHPWVRARPSSADGRSLRAMPLLAAESLTCSEAHSSLAGAQVAMSKPAGTSSRRMRSASAGLHWTVAGSRLERTSAHVVEGRFGPDRAAQVPHWPGPRAPTRRGRGARRWRGRPVRACGRAG